MIRYLYVHEEEQNWRENEVPKIKSTYKELFGDEALEMIIPSTGSQCG